MFRCRSLAVAAFALWTLLIWGQRIVNIAKDDTLAGGELAWNLARAIAFVVVGIAVAVVAVRPMDERRARTIVRAGAGVTLALWAVQMIAIPLRDHDLAFIVVHLVLGAISISLAVWAARSFTTDPIRRPLPGTDEDAEPATSHA